MTTKKTNSKKAEAVELEDKKKEVKTKEKKTATAAKKDQENKEAVPEEKNKTVADKAEVDDSPKKSKDINKENKSVKALYFNRGYKTSWKKIDKPVKVEDIEKGLGIPLEANLETELLLEDGRVYSLKERRITGRNAEQELKQLKSIK